MRKFSGCHKEENRCSLQDSDWRQKRILWGEQSNLNSQDSEMKSPAVYDFYTSLDYYTIGFSRGQTTGE